MKDDNQKKNLHCQSIWKWEIVTAMLTMLTHFTACCRAYGLPVATSELLDCSRQLTLLDPLDEVQFKTVLLANFAKSRRDQARFHYIYTLFFHTMDFDGVHSVKKKVAASHLSLRTDGELSQPDGGEATFQEDEEKVAAALDILLQKERREKRSALESELVDFLKGEPARFLEAVHQLNTLPGQQQRFFKSNMDQLSAKLSVMLTINRLRQKAVEILGGNFDHLDVDAGLWRNAVPTAQNVVHLKQLMDRRLDQAYALLTNEPRAFNDSLKENKEGTFAANTLDEKPFSSLTPLEIHQVREVLDAFAKKMKDQAGRRFAIKNRGRLDIKKTLREAGKTDGTPIRLTYKDKPLNKASLVVLCDISGSVWSSARFMLNILFSLQTCFHRIRSYLFVADLAEVTDRFKEQDVDAAMESVFHDCPVKLSEPTDYGASFQAFKKDHSQRLDHKTTLIIMGDGRSNYQNPQAHLLAEFREKCRRIIWLTPEPGRFWNTGDCELFAYRPHCHEIRTCMNLNHLRQFIHELVL